MTPTDPNAVLATARSAARAIPPLWPLASSVAVNPFLGQADEPLATAAARLGRIGGIPATPSRAYQRERLADGRITDADLQAALDASPHAAKPTDLASLKSALAEDAAAVTPLPTVADLARDATGTDWPSLIADRFSAFAAAHFDAGQALWSTAGEDGLWAAWRSWATHDLTPEIAGLAGFARRVTRLPSDPATALAQAVDRLGLPAAAHPTCFHALLASLGGWAQYARYRHFEAERDGGHDDIVVHCLLVRLLWDDALLAHCGDAVADAWAGVVQAHAEPVTPGPEQVVDEIVQEAAERAAQRGLAETLVAADATDPLERPALQAAFCIDVRSEVFRRALETADSGIRTLGFAGFFGIAIAHRRLASDVIEHRAPALLRPALATRAGADPDADHRRRIADRASRAWGRFKLAAVSSFAFVESAGPIYIGRLLRDALGLRAPAVPSDPAPRVDPAIDLQTRIDAAENVLRAMSLTDGFARIVVLAGHGAAVVNNPHRSALHCGACGGHSGEVNARLLAALLNETDVRAGLATRGIRIPGDTLFVAALHDTTSDLVQLYDGDHPGPDHTDDLNRARTALGRAGTLARSERVLRLPLARDEADVARRGRNWAEVRQEWGLAGCRTFVAAPRARTRGADLRGGTFLHDYDWHADEGFPVLELILTAPVVVASWISLQYYGSAVAPEAFGAGNKLLHNVVGGIGVLEGNGGPLRAGLPRQSLDDGENPVHEPLRLSVYVQAPRDAIDRVLAAHDDVRTLFDHRWLHLFALDDTGGVARRTGQGRWMEERAGRPAAASTTAAA